MKGAFVIDTSLSMYAKGDAGLSYIDMAITGIETFVASRLKVTEHSQDKYFLFSTEETYPNMILSSWEHNLEHFLNQLKLIKSQKSLNSLHISLGYALNLLAQFRGNGAQPDIVTGGRLISRAESSLVYYSLF